MESYIEVVGSTPGAAKKRGVVITNGATCFICQTSETKNGGGVRSR